MKMGIHVNKSKEKKQVSLTQWLRQWASKLKNDIMTLYLSIKHPRMPLSAKIVAAIVVGYALSPIDFIPDFIPVLGYIDDIILLPMGIALALKMIPVGIINECRKRVVEEKTKQKPRIRLAAYIVIAVWIMLLYILYDILR